MNDMDLLRELAQETPLPVPAELDAARARLVAAIAADPAAGRVAAVPEAAVYQPDPSSGQPADPSSGQPADPPSGQPADPSSRQPAEPLRPPAPAPVQDAAKLMYGGAVGTVIQLVIALFYIGDIHAYHLTVDRHTLTTAQLIHLRPLIVTGVIVFGLVLIALWLWMARAVSQGRSWARILSTVLFGLATLQLIGLHSVAAVFWAMLTWLTGLAAVWQLWRPASSAFFQRCRQAALTRPR